MPVVTYPLICVSVIRDGTQLQAENCLVISEGKLKGKIKAGLQLNGLSALFRGKLARCCPKSDGGLREG